ncbi:MAG: PTS transporter subunit IIC [Erysipelotrichaceae bacterium]|jgi:PTS system galactitol-specific IIC component
MKFLESILNWYGALPSSIMIMLGILIIGLTMAKLKPFEALKAAIYVSAGMIAMGAMTGMFCSTAIPAVMAFVQKTGINLSIVDAGIGAMQTQVCMPLSFYPLLLPIGLVVNIILILIKFTDTFDVDIFNYFIWALTSAFIMAITNNVVYAIIGFVISEIVCLKLADLTAPAIAEQYGLEGVSIPHGNAIVFAPVGIFVNWIIEKIPALAKIDWDAEKIERRFGGMVQPSTIGFFMGCLIGIVAGYKFGDTMFLGVTIAAFMIVFPKVLNVLIEGITPVADGMREFSEKRLNRKLYIGLDAAILVGMPDVMATGILLVPLVILLAFILPGNKVMPLADLAIACPFLISCCMPFCKKNIFRGLICGIFVFTIALYVCTWTAEWYTAAAALNGLPLDAVSTSIGGSSTWLSWLVAAIFNLFA